MKAEEKVGMESSIPLDEGWDMDEHDEGEDDSLPLSVSGHSLFLTSFILPP